jgi:hypothetical protein
MVGVVAMRPPSVLLHPRHLAAAIGFCAVVAATSAGVVVTHEAAASSRGVATTAVSGAGHTIIQGGTGGAAPVPVTTLVAFHATSSGGDFECLALAPPGASGAGSGEFSTNVMYVTGSVTSVSVIGGTATLRGTATVTGIGAGQARTFVARVSAGGPGATVELTVSGLTFREILIDGHISVR